MKVFLALLVYVLFFLPAWIIVKALSRGRFSSKFHKNKTSWDALDI